MTGIPGSARTLSPDALASKFGASKVGEQQDVPEPIIHVTMVLRSGANADSVRQKSSTRIELREAHRPNLLDLQTVVSFARRHDLRIVDLDRPPRMVVLQGSVDDITTAFGTGVEAWVQPWPWPSGQSTQELRNIPFRLRQNKELQVPDDLATIVEGVFGIDDRKEARMHIWTADMHIWADHVPPPVAPALTATTPSANPVGLSGQPPSYTVNDVASRYNFPVANNQGYGQTIAIIAPGGRLNRKDLAHYCSTAGIEMPEVFEVPVDCELRQFGDQPDEDLEMALDVQIIAGLVPRASIVIYYVENTSRGFIDGLAQAIYNEYLQASIISISWGGYEESWTDQAKSVIEDLLIDAKALNITVCCASGDLGAWDGDPDGELHVDFPASSPHVLGCGGTTLPVDPAQREVVWSESEVVWNKSEGRNRSEEHLGSGGGQSTYFDKPDWQCKEIYSELRTLTKRGVPDVAGFADPRNGFTISLSERGVRVGGTSAAAPLWAGLIARINEILGSAVGYLNPLLYLDVNGDAFVDIREGNNGVWDAKEGWDRCTGLGRPDGGALLKELLRLQRAGRL